MSSTSVLLQYIYNTMTPSKPGNPYNKDLNRESPQYRLKFCYILQNIRLELY